MTDAAAPVQQQEKRLNLRSLLEEMIQRNASDLHITAGECPKLRVDGDIVNATEYTQPLSPKETLQVAYSVLTEEQKKRFETDDELDFSFGIADLSRFRGNCFKQRGCTALVIRQIPIQIQTFEDPSQATAMSFSGPPTKSRSTMSRGLLPTQSPLPAVHPCVIVK